MKDLMILFMPYFGLGIFSGVNIHNASHLDLKGFGILAAVFLAMGTFAWFLAPHSITKDGEKRFGLSIALSPGGWGFGFGLAFIGGLAAGIYCK